MGKMHLKTCNEKLSKEHWGDSSVKKGITFALQAWGPGCNPQDPKGSMVVIFYNPSEEETGGLAGQSPSQFSLLSEF